MRTFANRLGLDGDGALPAEMLDSGDDGDRRLTIVATGKNGVNASAA